VEYRPMTEALYNAIPSSPARKNLIMVLTHESFIFDPRPYYPLLATANRYLRSDSLHSNDPDALTLVFVHATGFHKEIWEPTMEDLYSFAERSELKIREMWSIDAPNHGEAAILNEKSLLWGYEPICKSARDVGYRAALPCL
jgi:hypothetical protein